MTKKKKENERKNAIIKIDTQTCASEFIGTFYGDLLAICREPESPFMYGFCYDVESQGTKVY